MWIAIKGLATGAALGVLLAYVPVLLNPKDSTDTERGRSGLVLYTDALTGCQYVKGGLFGGVHPRLRGDGTPMCDGAK